eukprot:m.282884 g.282884  ORF g.282884 m.282884 type:complete len:316 (+) comp11116_c0_seq8:1919-2866(+)
MALRSLVLEAASTTTPLLTGTSFASPAQDLLHYSSITCVGKADTACTLYVDQSGNGENWDHSAEKAVVADTGFAFSFSVPARYARVRVVNASGTNQLQLRLFTTATDFVDPTADAAAATEIQLASGQAVAHTAGVIHTLPQGTQAVSGSVVIQANGGASLSATSGSLNVAVQGTPSVSGTVDVELGGTSVAHTSGVIHVDPKPTAYTVDMQSAVDQHSTNTTNGTLADLGGRKSVAIAYTCTALGATDGAWNLQLEGSVDGTNFFELGVSLAFDAAAAAGYKVTVLETPVTHIRAAIPPYVTDGTTGITIKASAK